MKKTSFIVCILALVLMTSLLASCAADTKGNYATEDGYYGGDSNSSPSIGAPMDKEEIYDWEPYQLSGNSYNSS